MKMILTRTAVIFAICSFISTAAAPGYFDSVLLKNIANVSYADEFQIGSGSSIFSPRMDFEQWKPLTGRGDPLRNDPTYDYEPPVLDRVHYWADEPRPEREHRPERKSEVLMLGVSSRKPSIIPRQPPKRHHRPTPIKYEEFRYKLNEHYPMTILVPPPPPPPGHRPALFVLTEETTTTPEYLTIKSTEKPVYTTSTETLQDQYLGSLYALQEANLIFQSSSTTQNWGFDSNKTHPISENTVTSDYAGWGPTTPMVEQDYINDTYNLIFSDQTEKSKLPLPYSFYRPMLSEAPPPPPVTQNPLLLSSFRPTVLPPVTKPIIRDPTYHRITEMSTERYLPDMSLNINEEIVTENIYTFRPTTVPPSTMSPPPAMMGMLGPMMSMPLINGPDRPEDNLYAHASENIQIFRDQTEKTLDSMQTMVPPPITQSTESSATIPKKPILNPNKISNLHKKTNSKVLDPYLNMRYTTPKTTTLDFFDTTTTEGSAMPTYLIIQGHSKVKTYSSKSKTPEKETTVNEIPRPNETDEVKHLHPIKDKITKKVEKIDKYRSARAYNLQTLINEGFGSIEIQEKDLGIKYDVSDGSDVPVEIYRKGIVENDNNHYNSHRKPNQTRVKRQIGLEDLIPFDGDQIEEFVYNYFAGKKNTTGLTGLIASVVAEDPVGLDDEEDDEDR